MANQIAIRAHTEPGDALIAGRDAHVYLYEGGGAAALSGVQTALVGRDGLFTLDDVRGAVAPDDPHFARTRLVCLENTHNRSGGRVFPLADQRAIADWAHAHGLAVHLDGARLFNAAAATGESAAALAAPADTVSFCLSKGLGAPVGSLLCGTAGHVRRARRLRKLFGGGMRQAGILAAAGLFALEHHVARLADDHLRARRLAEGIATLPGIEVGAAPETNMVLCDVGRAAGFVEALGAEGVRVGAVGPRTLRLVTHLDIGDDEVDRAVAAFARVAAAAA